jgi:hypothetical protein
MGPPVVSLDAYYYCASRRRNIRLGGGLREWWTKAADGNRDGSQGPKRMDMPLGLHTYGGSRQQVSTCPKPSDQPRDAARREECSKLDEKSLTTFCRCDGRAKGFC